MPRKMKITCAGFSTEAEMLESECPKTCDAIWKVLPVKAALEVWKEEVYFDIPAKMAQENPTPKTTAGDVSYWPDGPAFCIFFGKSQPYSPVTTFARIKNGLENFRKLRSGDGISVVRAGD
ncbi:MAG: cyclophilin-like fold protein [Candidatus Hadarchaeota archaeon]